MTKKKMKDDEESVSSESKQPVKSVPALMGEGEKFFRDQLYYKAIECYTEALELGPGNKVALVERAACYLKIGRSDLSLADAEESLKDDKEYTKGLYQKAEALYAMGEFELALVFFHRGKKLRADIKEFQLGINKAQEAIDNCVGDPNNVKLELLGDLAYFEKVDEKNKKQQRPGGYIKPVTQQKQIAKREKRVQKTGSQKTVKQLLGELYADKVYLERLLEDDVATRANTKTGEAVYTLASKGLDFLDSRTEFWRQQKPIYARRSSLPSKPSSSKDPISYIMRQLQQIDNLQDAGKYSESLQQCQRLLIYVEKLSDKQLGDRSPFIAVIESNMGNSYLELGKYDMALNSHNKDLQISKKSQNTEGISRALENLGRVYARSGRFKEAIDVWEEKLPLATRDDEKAWLYHEIGRCYLEIGNNQKAREYGQLSYEAATRINDLCWQLNAIVLIAQAEAKMGGIENLESAIENFEKALEIAKKLGDVAAETAITKTWMEAKEKLEKLKLNQNEKSTSYKIVIKTASDNGAGTDANAYLSVYGTYANLDELKLLQDDTSQKPFETGKTSQFEYKNMVNVGEITRIKIRHDSNKIGSSWKISSIEIHKNGVEVYKFTLNIWLDEKNNSLEVQPDGSKKGTPVSSTYKVIVKTSKDFGSGTDSDVYLSMFSADGQLVDLHLVSSETNKNAFEAGRTDEFVFKDVKNIGKINRINLQIKEKGMSADWKCESVEIIKDTSEKYFFPVNKILSNKQKSLDFYPQSKSTSPESTTYKITIKTSKDLGAGTDSDVTISISGDKGDLVDLELAKSETNKNAFEGGQSDVFTLNNLKNIGKIKKITLRIEPKGVGADWKAETVEIVKDSKETYLFVINRALTKDNKSIEVLSMEQPSNKAENGKPSTYVISIRTSSEFGSGTDSNITMSMMGDKGDLIDLALQKSETNVAPFESGKIDVFTFTNLKNIGKINKIMFKTDAFGTNSDWKLHSVLVLKDSIEKYLFKIKKTMGEKQKTLEAEPTDVQKNTKGYSTYKVTVQTSREVGSGTDSYIYLKIFGTDGDIKETRLHSSETNKNDFEVGQTDVFTLRFLDNIGKIKKISLRSDSKGLGSDWNCDWLEILKDNKDTYYFEVSDVLGDKLKSVELVPGEKKSDMNKAKGDSKPSIYIVSIKTAIDFGSGTDSNITIGMSGEKGELLDIPLVKSETNKKLFESGQIDVFTLTNLKNIGKISKISLKTDATGSHSDWKVTSVKIIKDSVEQYTFKVTKTLGEKLKKLEVMPSDVKTNPKGFTDYKITVQTADEANAGTDSYIFLTIFGTDGDIREARLHNSETNKNDFERGQKDVFTWRAMDNIGKVKKIMLRTDGKGLGAEWKCDFVEIHKADNNEVVNFECNKILSDKQKSVELVLAEKSKDGLSSVLVVIVRTSMEIGSGTDSNVSINIYGEKGDLQDMILKKSETCKNAFEAGQRDVFTLSSGKNIGKIKSIKLQAEPFGSYSDWKVFSVEIIKDNAEKYTFPIKKELSKKIKFIDVQPAKIDTSPKGYSTYKVSVTTSNEKGSGTDANITLSIIGTNGEIKDVALKGSESNKNDFEQGQIDVFTLLGNENVGKINKILVKSDNKNLGSDWKVDKIEILKDTKETFVFNINTWIDSKTSCIEVTPQSNDQPSKVQAVMPTKSQTKTDTGDN